MSGTILLERFFDQRLQPIEDRDRRDRGSRCGRDLLEILAGVACHHVEAAKSPDVFTTLGIGMKGGDPPARSATMLGSNWPRSSRASMLASSGSRCILTAHSTASPCPSNRVASGSFRNGHHVQIHFGGQDVD